MKEPQGLETPHGRFLGALTAIRLQRVAAAPLYVQVADALEGVLAETPLALGSPIPAERELAEAIGVSRPTIRQALAYLEQRSLIYKRKGVGTFQIAHSINRPPRLTSLYDDLVDQGLNPETVVLELSETAAAGEIAKALRVPVGAPLLLVRRLRRVAATGIALMVNYLNVSGAPAPPADVLESTGLYEILRSRYGIELATASQRVSARLASKEEAQTLGHAMPCSLLSVARITFDVAGRGVEYATILYPGETEVVEMSLLP